MTFAYIHFLRIQGNNLHILSNFHKVFRTVKSKLEVALWKRFPYFVSVFEENIRYWLLILSELFSLFEVLTTNIVMSQLNTTDCLLYLKYCTKTVSLDTRETQEQ